MYKHEGGFPALYRGILPTIAGVAPYVCEEEPFSFGIELISQQVGLNFMVYETMRGYFTPEGQKDPSAIGKLGAGAVSGAVAQTCTYPL